MVSLSPSAKISFHLTQYLQFVISKPWSGFTNKPLTINIASNPRKIAYKLNYRFARIPKPGKSGIELGTNLQKDRKKNGAIKLES